MEITKYFKVLFISFFYIMKESQSYMENRKMSWGTSKQNILGAAEWHQAYLHAHCVPGLMPAEK